MFPDAEILRSLKTSFQEKKIDLNNISFNVSLNKKIKNSLKKTQSFL